MKTAIRALLLSSVIFTSCGSSDNTSGNICFDMEDSAGHKYSAVMHLPSNHSSKKPLPAVFIEDGGFLTDNGQEFWAAVDSLEEYGATGSVAVVCLDGKADGAERTDFFVNTFIPYVQEKWNVGLTAGDRICFGASASADRCLTLSMQNDTLFSEYWCFSPSEADLSEFGLLSSPVEYRICWSAQEEIEHFNYYPSLVNAIRKRGGKVDSRAFDNSIASRQAWWQYLFTEELKRRFPGQDSSLK